MKLDNPSHTETQIGPLARIDILSDLTNQLNDALNKGAKLRYQMSDLPSNGYFFPPSIVDDVNPSMNIYSHIFCKSNYFF